MSEPQYTPEEIARKREAIRRFLDRGKAAGEQTHQHDCIPADGKKGCGGKMSPPVTRR